MNTRDSKMVRIQPSSNVDNRRSYSERVSGFFNLLWGWDALVHLLGVLAGLGFLGYVWSAWVQELFRRGSYFFAVILGVIGVLLTGLSLARIPVAFVILFGCAAVSVVAFFGGYFYLLLP